ncbi:MAG: PTS sugar transporter subunit IIA [Phycisphaerales bacterium]|nr:PTS sugar transporter subunit IIA [Phycisphaerales bacterium]
MNLLDFLKPECVKVPLIATDKRAAIDELVDALAAAGSITDAGVLKEAVWTREQTRTTGIGNGLAIPHGKCAGIPSLVIAMGKPAQPIDFASIDRQPVKLIVLLASPPDRGSDHIMALAKISRMFMTRELREQIYAAETSGELYDIIKAQEGA